MPSLDEIEVLLSGDDDLRDRIVRSLLSCTVALFGIHYVNGEERLRFAGTGTLAVVGHHHGILTASHVWEVLKAMAKVGITMTDKINHRSPIDVQTIIPTVLERSVNEWDEHGPDLAFLDIPDGLVSGIEAYHIFEDLQKPPKKLGVESLECWIAMGTPEELGSFTQTHASVEINGNFVNPQYLSGPLDYYDFELDADGVGIPKSYGGFSGGGLWRVLVFSSPQRDKVDWEYRLKGVIFWQFPPGGGRRVIRCHGPESIARMAKMIAIE